MLAEPAKKMKTQMAMASHEESGIADNFAQDLDNVFGHYSDSVAHLEHLQTLADQRDQKQRSRSSRRDSLGLDDFELSPHLVNAMETSADEYGAIPSAFRDFPVPGFPFLLSFLSSCQAPFPGCGPIGLPQCGILSGPGFGAPPPTHTHTLDFPSCSPKPCAAATWYSLCSRMRRGSFEDDHRLKSIFGCRLQVCDHAADPPAPGLWLPLKVSNRHTIRGRGNECEGL